jgi:hypothetical protein
MAVIAVVRTNHDALAENSTRDHSPEMDSSCEMNVAHLKKRSSLEVCIATALHCTAPYKTFSIESSDWVISIPASYSGCFGFKSGRGNWLF